MHKLRIVLVLSILIASFMGCSFDSPTNWIHHYLISSDDAFAVDGKMVYVSITTTLPVSIYNPNNYSIAITISNETFAIPAHESIEISVTDNDMLFVQ